MQPDHAEIIRKGGQARDILGKHAGDQTGFGRQSPCPDSQLLHSDAASDAKQQNPYASPRLPGGRILVSSAQRQVLHVCVGLASGFVILIFASLLGLILVLSLLAFIHGAVRR